MSLFAGPERDDPARDDPAAGLRSAVDAAPAPRGPRRSHPWLLAAMLVVLLVGAGIASGLHYLKRYQTTLDSNIDRFGDPFSAVPESSRPIDLPGQAMNLLLLGTDSRIDPGDPSQWAAGALRTDAMMLAHVTADRSGAFVVSIPTDSWVDIPGRGKNKITAAFGYGGPAMTVRTVETLTRVRIDHVVVIDFEGFKDLTDALGGVKINVGKSTSDHREAFSAGIHLMDGATALNYVRQRYDQPSDDFDRVRRQQNWIRGLLKEMAHQGTLTDADRLNSALDALTSSISTDSGFTIDDMRRLATSMRDLQPKDVAFLTAPNVGTGSAPGSRETIVKLDPTADAMLWKAVAGDRMLDWIATHEPTLLSAG